MYEISVDEEFAAAHNLRGYKGKCDEPYVREEVIAGKFSETLGRLSFGEEVLQRFHRAQAELDPFFAPQHDDRARSVLSMTELLPFDENGRVRLPDEMIAHAALKEGEPIAFVGVGTKFQIWDKERFAPVLSKTLENARALRESSGNGSGT